MRKKVKYLDWWNGFDPYQYRIHQILSKHFDVEISDDPDYVICSVYSKEFYKYDCIRIFYTGENFCPDFNLFDYAIGFEYLEYGDRYIRCPNYLMNPAYDVDVERMLEKHKVDSDILNEKDEFCSFVCSNGKGNDIRFRFFEELSKYRKVNSGGRYLNNIGMPEGVPDKYVFQKKHKFSIAFENSSHPGYTTEKLVQAFAAGTVPIYWGDPLVLHEFNEKAMVIVNGINDIDQAVEKIVEIDNNKDLYLKMLKETAVCKDEFADIQYKELENFLVHIFEQPLKEARRRSDGVTVQSYYENFINNNTEQIKITNKSLWQRFLRK